jgi:hypothetical protein
MAVVTKLSFFWDIVPCSPYMKQRQSSANTLFFHYSAGFQGDTFLRNVG